jgi:hypothetical protein
MVGIIEPTPERFFIPGRPECFKKDLFALEMRGSVAPHKS